ncbi:hypothetical protein F2B00_28170 [Streptomyces parvus]|uniref:hypothetical protein n=1 Tax=Streptomyces parvus TaxID=66428 RepID=UPI001238DE14|nr:hypothetical protein [Streptomyces parvus]KAA6198975.1 hypothetical protein F2B00_28170 [Streptomyces parvus]GGS16431.1 hypothetical protein GCM10010221_12040 [Streptomyces parvus]
MIINLRKFGFPLMFFLHALIPGEFMSADGPASPGGKGALPARDHSFVGRCEGTAGGRETPI